MITLEILKQLISDQANNRPLWLDTKEISDKATIALLRQELRTLHSYLEDYLDD